MDTGNVGRNVGQNVGPDMARVEEPASPAAWYWMDDIEESVLSGPFETQGDAEKAAVAWNEAFETAGRDFVTGTYRRRAIECEVFRADHIFEALENWNEESIFSDSPPVWPQGEDAAELERRLAVTLRDFMRERDLFKQFRGLEAVEPE